MPKTRTKDPITSHLAAEQVKHLGDTKKAIIRILRRKQMNDTDLVIAYKNAIATGAAPNASESGIRSRRAELVERGYVIPSGRMERLASGRMSIIWKIGRRIPTNQWRNNK
jgi:hypothetical protein